MNIAAAYTYVDLMIDKANQPYFIDSEKDIFLNLSITEFLNKRYALMRVNQDYSEMFGNRESSSQTSSNVTVASNYCEFNELYHHLTYASLNGIECKIVSDDQLSELRVSNNPYKEVNELNPICAVTTTVGGDTRLYFHNTPLGGASPDFTGSDSFGIRWLKHLTVSDWEDIPEHYQHDILNVTVRKMTGNIESSNYTVQANEEQQ